MLKLIQYLNFDNMEKKKQQWKFTEGLEKATKKRISLRHTDETIC